jgi:FdhD protein
VAVRGDERRARRDHLAAEEPMEIRVAAPDGPGRAVAVTMRTPGHDFELATGFVVTEGVVAPGTVTRVAYCDDVGDQRFNVVTVTTTGPIALDDERRAVTSACGVCGKASLDAVEVRCDPVADGPVLPRTVLLALPDRLRAAQRIFEATGGLHAAGLFDAGGTARVVREDIGRHNAVDTVIGERVLAGGLPLADLVLVVSGRAGFEIVQKAAVAGIPILAAVSAPSSLAASAAERFGITLVGFLRGDGFNVYTRPERIGA